MSIEVAVPNLPESIQNATLSDWHKQPGDAVTTGETLVELETDKVMLEVPAPKDGVLLQKFHEKGDIVTSGEILAIIETVLATGAPAPQIQAPIPDIALSAVPAAEAAGQPLHLYAQPVSQ